ncbi:MAG: antibiotic biosynthesis monooxygenase [Solobacterium sp.]|nr:antibiotic biosynthesis monooxygenase [Solobacterium sp.]MBR6157120.1 antibiotic biosynthesis monooxygenase [Lachnospiraceae bacterium]
MYIIVIKNTAKEGFAQEYREASVRFMNEMKRLPGLIDAQVWQDNNDQNQILNVIFWESEEAAKADDGSLFIKYKPELKPYFVTNTTQTYKSF